MVSQTNPQNDYLWFVRQGQLEHGPFNRSQLVWLIMDKRLAATAVLRREDWCNWAPVLDCLDMISDSPSSRKAREERERERNERRIAAPRAAFTGQATIASGEKLALGVTSNISISGVFVRTFSTDFTIGTPVELTLQSETFKAPVAAKAEVTRFNANRAFDIGYGLRFTQIDNSSIVAISRIVGLRPISHFGEILVTQTPRK